VVSFRVRIKSRFLHHNYVVALLNDLLGIQSRGGCSCAGPYGHRLLRIDQEHSYAFQHEIGLGCDGIKPGWVRLNFNYFISDAVRDFLIQAVHLIAKFGHRLLTDYCFDPANGLWHHRAGPPRQPLRLRDLYYDAAGRLCYPDDRLQLGEDALAGHLAEASALLASRPDEIDQSPLRLPDDFEALRWFHLPPVCLR
jgi:hypothetical protein